MVIAVVANLENTSWVTAQGDAIAIAIDPTFPVFVCCKRQLVLPQATPINAVVVIHKMSVKSFNFLILLIFSYLRSRSSSVLTALSRRRNDSFFSARLSNSRFECGAWDALARACRVFVIGREEGEGGAAGS